MSYVNPVLALPSEESAWLRFEVCASPAHRKLKTAVWRVIARDGDTSLGEVRWYAHWHKYTFQPGPYGSVFEQDCLRAIADFCELKTREHRDRARALR